MIEGISGLSKAAWRLQATSLVLLPGFLIQYRNAEPSLKLQWRESFSLLAFSGFLSCFTFWCLVNVFG